jgi:hypothetical protein
MQQGGLYPHPELDLRRQTLTTLSLLPGALGLAESRDPPPFRDLLAIKTRPAKKWGSKSSEPTHDFLTSGFQRRMASSMILFRLNWKNK